MTDFTSKNNVYYDMNVYNPTSVPVKAQIDNKLLFPLLNRADDYSVSLAKAKVPLDSIPLTRDNLPLKLYQLGLKIGTTEELAYVRQVNANQDNFVWNCPKGSTTITKYKYSSTGTLIQVSQQNLQLLVPNIYNFVVDDFQNYFIVGSDTLSEIPNKVYVVDEQNIVLQTLDFVHVKHIYIDRGQNLYVCDEAPTPTVYIYSMLNGIGTVNITQKTTLTTNKAGNPLVNLLFCVADNEIIVGYNQNTITLYNEQYQPQTDIQEAAIKQLQNLANINATADTYVLANSNEIDDAIFGVQNQMVYDVNNNVQLTTGNIASPYCIQSSPSRGYAVGIDGYTYTTPYPITSPPARFSSVNTTTTIHAGCLWSAQKTSQLYALGTTYLYYARDFNCPPNIIPTNTWTDVGEFQLPNSITPINVDIQSSTNKVFVVGSDNNLYVSQNPIAQVELIFNNVGAGWSTNSLTWGLRQWDGLGNQQNSLLNNFSVWNNNVISMFKQGTRYFVAFVNGTTPTLNTYSIVDYSLISTNPNLDTNFIGMTNLYSIGAFAYQNNSQDIIIRNISTYAVMYSINVGYTVGTICELDATHIAVCESGIDGNIYIYNLQTLTLINTILLPNSVCDIAINQGDEFVYLTMFAVVQTQQNNEALGQQIYKITFTDNTYTNVDTQNVIYTTTRSIAQINFHKNMKDLLFIEGDYNQSTLIFNNVNFKSLMETGGYSVNNIITASMPNKNFMSAGWIPNKYFVYMSQSTSETYKWTQVSSNIPLKSVSVSRSNQNKLYGLSSTNSKIYIGNYLNNAITFTQFTEFTQTYDYLSNTINTDPTIQSTLYLYGTTSQNLITTLELNDECGAIAKNDVANQYVISYKLNNKIQALNAETLVSQFTSPLTGSYRIFTKNGSDIDAGKVDIYNMSVLIDGINNAFIEATTKINQALGSGTIATAPSISLNYQTGLCTLTYPSVLAQSANGILFNQSLLNIVYYVSTLDQQSGLYLLSLNPQAETITQNVKTINKFNQLDKILFRSNTIYVIGAYFGLNDSNNIFFDIDCPTTDWIENLDQTLYFQPNFLRTYFLRSNLALDNIQIQLYYQYKNGNAYELYINNGENITVKLQFISKV